MVLLDLPNELLLQIANHLGPEMKHLNSLLRTTRLFQRLLTPVLYRRAPSVVDEYGRSLLRSASAGGFISLIELLLENGALATIDARELTSGTTALQAAIILKQKAVVELLLKHGAGVNVTDKSGWTPLHWAALSGNCAIAGLLIDKGANLKINTCADGTVIHFAAGKGKTEMVKLLLDRGADYSVVDNRGVSAIHYTALAQQRSGAPGTNWYLDKMSKLQIGLIDLRWEATFRGEVMGVSRRSARSNSRYVSLT